MDNAEMVTLANTVQAQQAALREAAAVIRVCAEEWTDTLDILGNTPLDKMVDVIASVQTIDARYIANAREWLQRVAPDGDA